MNKLHKNFRYDDRPIDVFRRSHRRRYKIALARIARFGGEIA
jgi:hypothetical protein